MRTRFINNTTVDFDCLPTDIILYILLFSIVFALYDVPICYILPVHVYKEHNYVCNLSRRVSFFLND